jgi:catechol 2,3-dioxygenase-like lactoylglutathione lyase family enzyme
MLGAFFRWPVVIVADADRTASFYENVLGWQRWYDNRLHFDRRFHPVTVAGDRAVARLVVLGEGDSQLWQSNYEAPAIALMTYDEDIGDARDAQRTVLGRGDVVFMVRTDDVDAVYQRALAHAARISSPPTDWTIAHPQGLGDIGYRSVSFFDPGGTYVEATTKRFSP